MPETPLLIERLLSSPAFTRDLRLFLSLSEDVLLSISELGDTPEGFSGRPQAEYLNTHFQIPVNDAVRALHMAEHLYNRVTEQGLEGADAVNQIASVAGGLEEPIEIATPKRDAIQSILSFKRAYEVSNVASKALEDVPHFVNVSGSWSVKPVRTREGEVINVPVFGMSVVWHDSTAKHDQTFFFLDEEDWDTFKNTIDGFVDSRKDIDALL